MMKQLLIGLGAFAFTTAAFAADITNPFYLPKQGQLGSTTSVAFVRSKVKTSFYNATGKYISETSNSYDRQVNEALQFGLTDSVAFIGSVGNTFNKLRVKSSAGSSASSDTDTNTYFSTGLAWNILNGPTRVQLQGQYAQTHGGYRSVSAEIKAGYQFKTFLPYVSVVEELPLNQHSDNNKPGYSAKIGVYQGLCEVWALDTGLRWLHDENLDQRGYQAEAEASYYLNPKAAVSLYGTYLFEGKAKYGMKLFDKSVGMRLRWYFN